MTEVAQRQELGQAVPLVALFTAFLAVSLYGVGGGGGVVWARRIAVEKHRWLTDSEFADIVSLCQFMPGPNIVGIAVCVGAKMRGTIGTIAAVSGFLVIPWAIGLSVGLLFLEYVHLLVVRNILGGIAATAAGLLIATGIRLVMPHGRAAGFAAFCRAGLRSHNLRQTAAFRRFVRAGAPQYRHCRNRKGESAMTAPSAPLALTVHLALLSSISFGGF